MVKETWDTKGKLPASHTIPKPEVVGPRWIPKLYLKTQLVLGNTKLERKNCNQVQHGRVFWYNAAHGNLNSQSATPRWKNKTSRNAGTSKRWTQDGTTKLFLQPHSVPGMVKPHLASPKWKNTPFCNSTPGVLKPTCFAQDGTTQFWNTTTNVDKPKNENIFLQLHFWNVRTKIW